MKCFIALFLFSFGCKANTTKVDASSENEIKNEYSATKVDSSKIDRTQINALVWAHIILSEQLMYLYEKGEIIDTVVVTTGNKKHKTPTMNRKPSGPMFLKYTSKKFPGGDYMGLGNMPFVVFIRGGYAIHGTTPGNFSSLGRTGSHGCIRLHPTNAKVFYELVEKYSLNETWITIQM